VVVYRRVSSAVVVVVPRVMLWSYIMAKEERRTAMSVWLSWNSAAGYVCTTLEMEIEHMSLMGTNFAPAVVGMLVLQQQQRVLLLLLNRGRGLADEEMETMMD
jgi:hypothetical protein